MTKYEIDPYAEARRAWSQEKGNKEDWLLTSDTELDREHLEGRVARLREEGFSVAEELATANERIEALEQLCNDLFNHVCAEQIGARVNMEQFVELSERMQDLGLLEELHEQDNGNR